LRFVVLNGDVAPNVIPAMMNASDCLLLTSDSEGSPVVVQEALACNLPVVSVDVGDVRERLRGIWPSQIVDRNPEEIGKAIAEVLKSGQRSNGRSTVRDISCAAVAERTIAVYRQALKVGTAVQDRKASGSPHRIP